MFVIVPRFGGVGLPDWLQGEFENFISAHVRACAWNARYPAERMVLVLEVGSPGEFRGCETLQAKDKELSDVSLLARIPEAKPHE